MIFKIGVLSLIVFCISFYEVYCQSENVVLDIDSIPVINFYNRSGITDSIVYIKSDGERITVNCDIEFLGGWNALDVFCDSLYYKRKVCEDQELNIYIIYSVLFDNNLKIREIRIHKGVPPNMSHINELKFRSCNSLKIREHVSLLQNWN